MKKIICLLVCVLFLVTLAPSMLAQGSESVGNGVVVLKKSNQSQEEILNYWTEERMKSAKPIPFYAEGRVEISSESVVIYEPGVSGSDGVITGPGAVGGGISGTAPGVAELIIIPAPVCGNGICEQGESEDCNACSDFMKPCPMRCKQGSCPQDCEKIKDNKLKVKIPSDFTLSAGQTAYVSNYHDMQVKLERISLAPSVPRASPPIACSMEAKLCHDGSYVSRTGPNCEFAPCPDDVISQPPSSSPIGCTREANLCPDGSYVSRTGPNCEFAPCSDDVYVIISISTPGGCGAIIVDTGCLGAPAYYQEFTIKEGETTEVLGVKITFVGMIYGQALASSSPIKNIERALFRIAFADCKGKNCPQTSCPENCKCEGRAIICRDWIEPVEVQIESGGLAQLVKIDRANSEVKIVKGNVSAKAQGNIVIDNKKLYIVSGNRTTEVKIMPDTASQVAISQLKLKGYEIELKDVGKPVYEIDGTKDAKILGLFGAKMRIKSQVDAQTGQVIKTQKPWWSFLASE